MVVNLLLIVLILLRLVIGLRLLITARQNNLSNLNWLALFFLLQVVFLLFAPTVGNPLGNLSISLLIFGGGTAVQQVPVILFNQETFYRARPSPVFWFWILALLGGLATFYGVFTSASNFSQSPWIAAYVPIVILVWVWHGWLAYQAVRGVENDPAVEDWVKARYKLVIAYAITSGISAAASFVRIVFAGGSNTTELGNLTAFISLVMQIASVGLQFLAWVMPEFFRRWLNRNQKVHEEENIHKQALTILNVLGSAMSEDTGISRMMGGYAIRIMIGKNINTEDNTLIEAHAVRMSYNELQALLANPELGKVIASSAENSNTANVIAKAQQALIAKQSLFTMQAR